MCYAVRTRIPGRGSDVYQRGKIECSCSVDKCSVRLPLEVLIAMPYLAAALGCWCGDACV